MTERILREQQNAKAQGFLANHHGSTHDNSNSENWLTTVAPEFILINAGMHTGYKHPTQEFVNRVLLYFRNSPPIAYHPFTFYSRDNNLNDPSCKVYMLYANGFSCMTTPYPMYNMLDTDTIEFIVSRVGITFIMQHAITHLNPKECILQDIQAKIDLNNVQVINLDGLELEDHDIVTKLYALPSFLKRLEFKDHKLTNTSLHTLMRIFMKCNYTDTAVLTVSGNKAIGLIQYNPVLPILN